MLYALTAIVSFSIGVLFTELTIVLHAERDDRRRNDAWRRRRAVREMRRGMTEMFRNN